MILVSKILVELPEAFAMFLYVAELKVLRGYIVEDQPKIKDWVWKYVIPSISSFLRRTEKSVVGFAFTSTTVRDRNNGEGVPNPSWIRPRSKLRVVLRSNGIPSVSG